MITDKPEDLEARATHLEAEADQAQLIHHASDSAHRAACREIERKLEVARSLRQQAADLRKRRVDGVRFG